MFAATKDSRGAKQSGNECHAKLSDYIYWLGTFKVKKNLYYKQKEKKKKKKA